jgi:hypothetical protein
MSLYNNLFGFNGAASVLLRILKIELESVPRFRDCFYDTERGLIVIHTRTGGGNREDYIEENNKLTLHDCYNYDEDDDFDSTYANFYFSIPAGFERLKEVYDGYATVTPAEKWQSFLLELDSLMVKIDGE